MASKPQALRVAVLHGPNLNLLGQREPEIYGKTSLSEIDRMLVAEGLSDAVAVICFQSNHEGDLIDEVHRLGPNVDGFLVNAGGYSHTSVALLDALVSVGRPYVDVHLSNLMARESFRQHSLLAGRAVGAIMGFGADSYLLGLRGLLGFLRRKGS